MRAAQRVWIPALRPPALPPTSGLPPSLLSTTSPSLFVAAQPPPSILSSRAIPQQRLVLPTPAPYPAAWQELTALIDSLPPIASSGPTALLRLAPQASLERELVIWRRACWGAYTALRDPGLHYKARSWFRNSVVRIVAHTMRLMRILGHLSAAKELDRAFFTTQAARKGKKVARKNFAGDAPLRDHLEPELDELYGEGIGLQRGVIQLAWMQSLAIRLEPGLFDDLDDFTELLGEMQHAGSKVVDEYMIAFLLRQSEGAVRKIGYKEKWREERMRLEDTIEGIKGSRKFGRETVVLRGIIEHELICKEGSRLGVDYLNSPEYSKLEMSISQLLDQVHTEEIETSPSPPTDRQHPTQEVVSLDHRAHTLHLAIRFLLVRAQAARNIPDIAQRRESIERAISSAISLYSSLVSLTQVPCIRDNPLHSARMRLRLTSALYRISWASIGTFNPELPEAADSHSANPPPLDFSILEQAFEAIDSTMRLLAIPSPPAGHETSHPMTFHVNPSPFISTQFWRNLLLRLSLPAAPSRRGPNYTPAERPPWSILQKAFDVLIATRRHKLLSVHTSAQHRLFVRSTFMIHLTRAVILGDSDVSNIDAIENMQYLEAYAGGNTVQSRLEHYFNFLDKLEETGERVRKGSIVQCAIQIIGEEFPGIARSAWRKELRLVVLAWSEKSYPRNPTSLPLSQSPTSIPYLPFSITQSSQPPPIAKLRQSQLSKMKYAVQPISTLIPPVIIPT